jgi:prepilin-type N-terminal cleavage/methylation domain-containing protein/prepilin-type processing-associated H-X9-DG protein
MFFFHKRYALVTLLTCWCKGRPKRYVHRNGVGVWIEPRRTRKQPAAVQWVLPPVEGYTKRGFTLIELLVVISIIALLIGILLPSLAMARRSAESVQCKSNIRSLAIVNIAYSTDNKNYFVPATYDEMANLERWHGNRNSTSEAFDPATGRLASYLDKQGQAKKCPTLRHYTDSDPGAGGATYEAGSGGYGYNHQFIGGRYDLAGYGNASKLTARVSDVNDPVGTIMFTDAANYNTVDGALVLIENSFAWSPHYVDNGTVDPYGSYQPTPTTHFRHNGKTANIAWIDGHADDHEIEHSAAHFYLGTGTGDETMKYKLGWFGPTGVDLYDLK